MKIYLPKIDQEAIGGGWVFVKNLVKALKDKVEFVRWISDCDIFFVPSTTMVTENEIDEVEARGKKIVVRVDGIPKNSRNTDPPGIPHFFRVTGMADVIVYQSQSAKEFLEYYLKYSENVVILNGADTSIFKSEGLRKKKDGNPQYLYSRYRRDEMKRMEKAWWHFQWAFPKYPDTHIWFVGRYGQDCFKYDFDLFGGAEKRFKYLGIIKDQEEMASIYRGADVLLLPYFQDPCSNVAIEARLCGLNILYDEKEGGGTKEIMTCPIEYLSLERMGNDYLKLFESL